MQNLETVLSRYDGAFYVFDVGVLKQRVAHLRQFLPQEVDMCYAVKANTFVIHEIESSVERLEICSPGEYYICRDLKVPSEKMVISGVNKSEPFIASLIADPDFRGVFTIESLLQLEIIRRHAAQQGRVVPVLIRLTNGSQFGVNEADILDILQQKNPELDILGIQFFSGTQKTSVKKLRRELEKVDTLIEKIETELGFHIREMEYGTGFPVSYFDPEGFDEETYMTEFGQMLREFRSKVKITLEIGRSIAACCGRYFTGIVDLKTNKGQNYMLIDGGMHHLVYFGQHMAMSRPPFFVWGKQDQEETDAWTICGSLCSMNDLLAKQVTLPPVEVGDVLCFENTGAYCMTEGISLFLSRDIPAVYLRLESGEMKLVRRRIETCAFNMPVYE